VLGNVEEYLSKSEGYVEFKRKWYRSSSKTGVHW